MIIVKFFKKVLYRIKNNKQLNKNIIKMKKVIKMSNIKYFSI